MALTQAQLDMLTAALDRGAVRTRQQAGRSLSYVEGWHVIAEANRIFGFADWASETIDVKCVNERDRGDGKNGVTYTAKVRVTVYAGDRTIVREGIGAGHGIDRDIGQAHESAIKEAETDARKRALMTWGNPFGLALYDKDQRNVADAEPAPRRQPPSPALVASVVRGYVPEPEAPASQPTPPAPKAPAKRPAPAPVPLPADRNAAAASQKHRDGLLADLAQVYTPDDLTDWKGRMRESGVWARLTDKDRADITRAVKLKDTAVKPVGGVVAAVREAFPGATVVQ
jgi:DNA recombination protein Rad52